MSDVAATCEITTSMKAATYQAHAPDVVFLQVVRDPANTDVWDEVASPFEVVKQINR